MLILLLIGLINCNIDSEINDLVDNYVQTSNFISLIDNNFTYLVNTTCNIISPPSGICNKETDSEGYYKDYDDCINHFMNIYPKYGPLDQLLIVGNNSICRLMHLPLSYSEKCSILGKTGGDKCIDNFCKMLTSEKY